MQAIDIALWVFWSSDDFKEIALKAGNLSEDAGTTDAIYNQLTGAYYGLHAIPEAWRKKITMSGRTQELPDALYTLSCL